MSMIFKYFSNYNHSGNFKQHLLKHERESGSISAMLVRHFCNAVKAFHPSLTFSANLFILLNVFCPHSKNWKFFKIENHFNIFGDGIKIHNYFKHLLHYDFICTSKQSTGLPLILPFNQLGIMPLTCCINTLICVWTNQCWTGLKHISFI